MCALVIQHWHFLLLWRQIAEFLIYTNRLEVGGVQKADRVKVGVMQSRSRQP